MHSSITNGMPYATMRYENFQGSAANDSSDPLLVPTVWSQMQLSKKPTIDNDADAGGMECTLSGKKAKPVLVNSEVEVLFDHSDFTWLVFVSEPVLMQCVTDDTLGARLQVVEFGEEPETPRDLIVRIALKTFCSTGNIGVNPVYCHLERMHPTALMLGQGNYGEQLRSHAHLFPGPMTAFDFDFDDAGESAWMHFDWDVQDMKKIALYPVERNNTSTGLLTYALPHHYDVIKQAPPTDVNIYCVASLIGPACLYEGSKWDIKEQIPVLGFRAPRPPAPWAMSSLAKSLAVDMQYRLPKFYQRGSGDTYFSGKMLSRLGRVLVVADEVKELCDPKGDQFDDYKDVCHDLTLPSDSDFTNALGALRSSVEVWINGTAETPFVFDSAWGGVVSCGCWFDGDKQKCTSHFPECPAFEAPGLNFGVSLSPQCSGCVVFMFLFLTLTSIRKQNGFYNDHHFHYGYHIMAAAIVAHFDPEWGRQTFEQVLLLVRDIANPSEDDEFFPTWRQKDWYSGHSWASGIAQDYLNGKVG
jgi:Glycosyl hydrolase family 81 C-terminal domain